MLFRKAVDPIVAGLSAVAINLAWVTRPWVDANDSLAAVLVRFGVTAVTVWLVGRLVRDPDERRSGYYGYRSSRALRSPDRPFRWLWIGDRLEIRIAEYRDGLDGMLGGLGMKGPWNRDFAEQVADRLWARMTADIPDPLDEWESLPNTTEIGEALARERAAAAERRAHHVETITLVVPVLAADPAALTRVAAHLTGIGRTTDAQVVEFQRMLAEALWARFGAAEPAASRHWRERLATALKDRNTLRAEYLDGPRRALLEEIKHHYHNTKPADSANLRRARAALRALEFELEGMSRPRSEPLEAAAQLADQRARSAADAAAAEARAHAAGRAGATAQRVADQQALAAAMRVLAAAANLGVEVQLSDPQRRWNRQTWAVAMAAAVATAPNATPATLLERLLVIAGRKAPVTPDRLAAEYGGTGWETALAALADMGALTGDAVDGYRVDAPRAVARRRSPAAARGTLPRRPQLAELWRDAGPRLRHAVRAGPLVLPGGAGLAPLTVEQPVAGVTAAEKAAYAALRDLLREGDLAFRHWRDGWRDDARITLRRLAGLGHLLRHPASRLGWPLPADRPAAVVRIATAPGTSSSDAGGTRSSPASNGGGCRACCARSTAPTGSTTAPCA
ncbi:hypothetical protein BJF78_19250 [Pseudonocardia sp. CNS-139]|nr:hypothetical protein BJF78_19250 [Pseudonocardia sp. CNS-139]